MTARLDQANRQRWFAHILLVLAHGAIFGVVGPAIGAILSPGVIFLPLAVVAAYMVSFGAAVMTGLLVGLLAPFVRNRVALYSAGTAAGAICAMVFPFAFMTYSAPAGLLIVYAISGAFAGLVCTRLTRPVRRRWLVA